MTSPLITLLQKVCFSFAFITNITLIILIFTKSPNKLGSYKYLMIFFATVSLSYSVLEAWLNFIPISYKDCFQVITKIKFENSEIDRFILSFGCGFCGIIMSMFVVHFIFRFFALQRKGNLKYFEGFYFMFWLFIPVGVGLGWGITVLNFLQKDAESSEYMRTLLMENYSLNLTDIVYVGILYYKKPNHLNIDGMKGILILGSIMTICFILIVYFGFLTYRKIQNLILEGRSEYTRMVQRQLYHALVIQTLIPILFVVIPLSIYFFTPLFHFGFQIFGDVTTVCLAIYPVIDPLPVIFVVDNYRVAILEFIGCRQIPRDNRNSTSISNAVEN